MILFLHFLTPRQTFSEDQFHIDVVIALMLEYQVFVELTNSKICEYIPPIFLYSYLISFILIFLNILNIKNISIRHDMEEVV